MKSITTAQRELNNLKNDIIGIYKPNHKDSFELVLEECAPDKLKVIYISQFGAITTVTGVETGRGILHFFPDNKNMNDMLNNPFEWDVFIKQFE